MKPMGKTTLDEFYDKVKHLLPADITLVEQFVKTYFEIKEKEIDFLVSFQIYLLDEDLITSEDWDYADEAQKFLNELKGEDK